MKHRRASLQQDFRPSIVFVDAQKYRKFYRWARVSNVSNSWLWVNWCLTTHGPELLAKVNWLLCCSKPLNFHSPRCIKRVEHIRQSYKYCGHWFLYTIFYVILLYYFVHYIRNNNKLFVGKKLVSNFPYIHFVWYNLYFIVLFNFIKAP